MACKQDIFCHKEKWIEEKNGKESKKKCIKWNAEKEDLLYNFYTNTQLNCTLYTHVVKKSSLK